MHSAPETRNPAFSILNPSSLQSDFHDTLPLAGKTYTLYGSTVTTDEYYRRIAAFADACLTRSDHPETLLSFITELSGQKRRCRSVIKRAADSSMESFLLHRLSRELSGFTQAVPGHLQGLSLKQRWDSTIAMSREQYHLFMLEAELRNRANVAKFGGCDTKLAFLPHCLRDHSAQCLSVHKDIDFVCAYCTADCTIHHLSKLLRRHHIQPYLWLKANLRSVLKRYRKEGRKAGVLGIACIPELVHGMRLCARYGIPVIGVPLDANRCRRWCGEFHFNTVNTQQLEKLLSVRPLPETSSEIIE
jgi:hypothetical protein